MAAKKAVKKKAKKTVIKKRAAPKSVHVDARRSVVVGQKSENDSLVVMRIPKELAEQLKHLVDSNGEIHLDEDAVRKAMQYTSDVVDHVPDSTRYAGPLFRGLAFQPPKSEKSILVEAEEIIYGDREKTYGAPDANLRTIGDLWSVYLRRARVIHGHDQILPSDVCQLMIMLKSARLLNDPDHRDSKVDQAGYAALAQRLVDERPF